MNAHFCLFLFSRERCHPQVAQGLEMDTEDDFAQNRAPARFYFRLDALPRTLILKFYV